MSHYTIQQGLWESIDAVLFNKAMALAKDVAAELNVPAQALIDILKKRRGVNLQFYRMMILRISVRRSYILVLSIHVAGALHSELRNFVVIIQHILSLFHLRSYLLLNVL